jgi:SAM-dependent methyltransferase
MIFITIFDFFTKTSKQIMSSFYQQVTNSPDFLDYDKYYWGYQYRLSKEVIIPYLKRKGILCEGLRIIEIGAAEGGVLMPFLEAGASSATGTDIDKRRIQTGSQIAALTGQNIELFYHNIMTDEIPEKLYESADLVILRDVIEHLDNTLPALIQIKKLIKKGGFLFITFPPYHSPFGGHQHTLATKKGMIPYIHLLPGSLFKFFLKGGRKSDIAEVNRLKTIKLTPFKFIKSARDAGYDIYSEEYYLLRPVFKMKFGLPALKYPKIITPGFVKKYFSLEASFILKKS